MAKLLPATANASGIVTVEVAGFQATIDDAVILGDGKQASSGILLIDGTRLWYIPSTVSDLKTTIEKVVTAVSKIAETLTAIGGGMTGGTTAPPPTLGAKVAEINATVTELNTLKGALK